MFINAVNKPNSSVPSTSFLDVLAFDVPPNNAPNTFVRSAVSFFLLLVPPSREPNKLVAAEEDDCLTPPNRPITSDRSIPSARLTPEVCLAAVELVAVERLLNKAGAILERMVFTSAALAPDSLAKLLITVF